MASSFPHNQNFQQFLHQSPSQPQQSNLFRNFVHRNNVDGGQISQHQVASFFNSNNSPNLTDQRPPYIVPCLGLGQGPANAENEFSLQWVATEKKTPVERLFLEDNICLNGSNNINNNNSSQLSDLFQVRSVSTGLGLSLENTRLSSSGDSALSGFTGETLEQELLRQDAEIDRYIKVQGDRLRQAILGKFQVNQLQTMSYIEEKIMQKLQEKDTEIEDVNRKNLELELRLEELTMEANTWQQCAEYSENTINALKQNLQQVYTQSRDSKEGYGDSDNVEDTASHCNGHTMDFQLLCKGGTSDTKERTACKVCRVNEVCMLLLPCKHLCLCKECESKLSMCPLCHSSKFIGIEVYM